MNHGHQFDRALSEEHRAEQLEKHQRRLAREKVKAAAPDLLAALQDLLGVGFLEQDPHSEWFICPWCGRDLPDNNGQPIPCDSDDCSGYKARQAITKATQ